MANKVLGRELRDLLSRARPLRFVELAAGLSAPDPIAPPTASEPESVPAPQALELPFDRPKTAEPAPVPSVPAPPTASKPESVAAPQVLELPFDPPKTAEPASVPSVPAPPVAPVAPRVSALKPPAAAPAPPLPEAAPWPSPELVGSTTTLWFPVLLSLDVVLLLAAAFLVFDPRVRRPLGLYLAGAAVLCGALFFALAFVARARRRKRLRSSKMSARIHIHITRA